MPSRASNGLCGRTERDAAAGRHVNVRQWITKWKDMIRQFFRAFGLDVYTEFRLTVPVGLAGSMAMCLPGGAEMTQR